VKAVAALVLAGCVLGPATAFASWFVDGDLGIVHETNVGLAQKARDVKSDSALGAGVSGGYAFQLDDRNVLSLAGDLAGSGYAELPGLSNLAAGATTAFRSKFGFGGSAPWLRLFASGARLEYDNDVRDGWRYRLGAGGGMRFGERWDVRLDYVFEERFADRRRGGGRLPGDVFDTTAHAYSARVDFLSSEALTLFSSYTFRDGDVVSTTRRNAEILAASSALTADRAFGPDFVAYKIDATVHVLTFGMSIALGSQASLNVAYERQIGLGRGGLDYFNDVFRGGVLVSF